MPLCRRSVWKSLRHPVKILVTVFSVSMAGLPEEAVSWPLAVVVAVLVEAGRLPVEVVAVWARVVELPLVCSDLESLPC